VKILLVVYVLLTLKIGKITQAGLTGGLTQSDRLSQSPQKAIWTSPLDRTRRVDQRFIYRTSKSEFGWGRYGFRKVCTSGTRLDRIPRLVRPPYPAKYELEVVFWHAFVRVSTPNWERPPLPINITCHGRLKGYPQSNLPITLLSFYLSFPLIFQPHVLFLYYLHDMRGCPS
jgi:hypothetical protein